MEPQINQSQIIDLSAPKKSKRSPSGNATSLTEKTRSRAPKLFLKQLYSNSSEMNEVLTVWPRMNKANLLTSRRESLCEEAKTHFDIEKVCPSEKRLWSRKHCNKKTVRNSCAKELEISREKKILYQPHNSYLHQSSFQSANKRTNSDCTNSFEKSCNPSVPEYQLRNEYPTIRPQMTQDGKVINGFNIPNSNNEGKKNNA